MQYPSADLLQAPAKVISDHKWGRSDIRKDERHDRQTQAQRQGAIARFLETAGQISADEEASAADSVMERLAKLQPEQRKPADRKK